MKSVADFRSFVTFVREFRETAAFCKCCELISEMTNICDSCIKQYNYDFFTRATLSVERVFATATCPSACLLQPVLYHNGHDFRKLELRWPSR